VCWQSNGSGHVEVAVVVLLNVDIMRNFENSQNIILSVFDFKLNDSSTAA
jgi:hypothetical protein